MMFTFWFAADYEILIKSHFFYNSPFSMETGNDSSNLIFFCAHVVVFVTKPMPLGPTTCTMYHGTSLIDQERLGFSCTLQRSEMNNTIIMGKLFNEIIEKSFFFPFYCVLSTSHWVSASHVLCASHGLSTSHGLRD